jgi:very-short-patch-repair endonuclease
MPSYRKRPRRKLPPPHAGGGEQSDAQQTIARGRGTSATQRSRELRAQASKAEQELWGCFRRKPIHGYRFRRQFPIGPYFADFCCLPVRLVIEVDGDQHAEPAQALHEVRRTAWLSRNNFHVVRFPSSDVITNIENVLDVIERVVSEQEQLLRYSKETANAHHVANSPLPLRDGASRTRRTREAWGRGRS